MKLHGKNGSIWVNGAKLATAQTWDLRAQREYADVSVYGDEGKVFAAGLFAVEIQFTGLLDVGVAALWTAMNAGLVDIAVKADDASTVAHGKGYVDAGASAAVNDAVKMAGSVKGSGTWVLGS